MIKPQPVTPATRPADCCGAPPSIQTDDEALAALSKALGHPARAAIVRLLGRQEECCGEIVSVLGLPQSTVSQHLKVLKRAGLVQGQVDGTRIHYCIDRAGLDRLRVLVDGLP